MLRHRSRSAACSSRCLRRICGSELVVAGERSWVGKGVGSSCALSKRPDEERARRADRRMGRYAERPVEATEADLEYGMRHRRTRSTSTPTSNQRLPASLRLWLAVAMLISGAIVYGTLLAVRGPRSSPEPRGQLFPLAAGQTRDPPTPRLQAQPFRDVYQLKSAQLDKLHSYGWVDQATGVVHIPIDEAMRPLSERDGFTVGRPDARWPESGRSGVRRRRRTAPWC